MSHPTSLQAGTRIDDYEIRETLWTTNSGFIYRARELDRDRDVLIQEYLPSILATRHWSGIHAMAREGLTDEFDQGLTQFLREARILAQINDPYVCRVYEYTEANATAYMVLDYEPGRTLKERLETGKTPLAEDEIRKLLVPLLKGLRVAHAAELLHRDIHPANIYLRDVGPPVLIGFGSPLAAPRDDSQQHVESRVAPGYSPVEQYQSEGALGPWSDLYALGATMYRCLSGAVPLEATRRVTEIAQDREDPLVPAMELGGGDYSAALLSAIDWMLEPMAADRPESAGGVLGPLSEEHPAGRPAPSSEPAAPKAGRPPHERGRSPQAIADRSSGYRDHSKRRPPLPRVPLPPGGPSREPPPRTALDAYPASKKLKSLASGWGWPLTLIVAGISLLVVFLFYRPGSSGSDAVTATSQAASATDGGAAGSELPQKVDFSHKEDNARAARYRHLERQTQQIEKYLAAAQQDMKQGHLLSPAGDNALANYRSVLALDPGQVDAKLGIAGIQSELIESADSAFADHDIDKANHLLDQAAQVREQSKQGRALRQKIEQYTNEQARQEQLARQEQQERERARQQAAQQRREQARTLLAKADSAFKAGRLTQPPDDNALAYFRRVLRLEPDNSEATKGVQRIGKQYLDEASDALAKDELDKADGLLNAAAAILPDNDSIPLLRKQLDTRRAVVKREQEEARRQQEEKQQKAEAANQVASARDGAAAAESQTLEQGIAAYYGGDYDTAFRLLNPLAEDGVARAKMRVAMMYYHGRGVKQDVDLADTLIREALPGIRAKVAAGKAWAQADLASLYADGIVLAENDKEALRLYTLAATQGYSGAQTNLGVMYANGQGVEESRKDAIMWFRRAAAQGDHIAQKNLRTLGVQ